ncbi:MAG: hypothetical protein ACJAZK_002946 [Psychroserpens sp.]|jgi:hypothetical protein|uniref:hypothetical protein n=1 Tax=Psychroserpens sp. TaxID=2020870 RepID=UPI0039E34FDF
MKNIFKIMSIVVLVFTFSCDDNEENRFVSDPSTGWMQFATPTSGTTISIITEELILPVVANVPVYENGMTLSYQLVAVEGDFTSIVTTGSSIYFEPGQASAAGNPRVVPISLNFTGVSDLQDIVVFDVVLTAIDNNGVTIGLNDASITSYRISTPCPLDVPAIVGTYSVDEVFTSGVNAGLSLAAAFGESYQVEISLDPTDPTQTVFILNNSIGFNQYFVDGSTASLDTCNGTITFSNPLNLGDFADMVVETTSYTESPAVMIADGPLGNFGPYQFILTKQ